MAILVLDEDRTNNTRTEGGTRHPLALRLTMNWMMWLQDAMLTYTGVL